MTIPEMTDKELLKHYGELLEQIDHNHILKKEFEKEIKTRLGKKE